MTALVDMAFHRTLEQYVDLEGADGEYTLYTSAGTLVSVLEWHGTRHMLGDDGMERCALHLRERLAPHFSSVGHGLQVVFGRDPIEARDQARAAVLPVRDRATRLQLTMDDVLDGREDMLAAATAWQGTWITLYSHAALATSSDNRESRASQRRLFARMPPLRDAQIPAKVADTVRVRHDSFLDGVVSGFTEAGQVVELLPADRAAAAIGGAITPGAQGSVSWQPRLAGAKSTGPGPVLPGIRLPETRAQLQGMDMSWLATERLSSQLFRDHAGVANGIVTIGDTSFLGFDLALFPETVTPFEDLLHQTIYQEPPLRWRMSFLIEPAGLQGRMLQKGLATVFTFLAREHNSRIRDAFAELREIDGTDDTVVRVRCCGCGWTDVGHEATLIKTVMSLRRVVERWGNARTDRLTGDPVATAFASLPACGMAATAPPAAVPLTHAVAMLPISCAVSPWQQGPVTLLTPEGRLWPYSPGSASQTSWFDLISGMPGSGKSVLLNTLNCGTVFSSLEHDDSGPVVLPLIGVIDVGASASGLVELFRDALPAERRHEVAMAVLRNNRAHAINIFDTPTGCRQPPELDRAFQHNFLRVLLADAGDASDRLDGLIRATVVEAYRMRSDDESPLLYQQGAVVTVDQFMKQAGVDGDGRTWWQLVDELMAADQWELAEEAQRQAVPVLGDLPQVASGPRIDDVYRDMTVSSGERAQVALQRIVTEAVAEWPMLTSATSFAMRDASIRVIDLQDVTGRGNTPAARRRSALMYMLARHVCVRDYWLDEEEIGQIAPPVARERLMRSARRNRRTPKRLCMDEFHRVAGLPGICDQVTLDVREGRKHNVQVALASQLLEDFDDSLVALATGIWICSTRSEHEIRVAVDRLGLDSAAEYALRHRLTRPSAAGAPVLAVIEVDGTRSCQLLWNRLGPREIWAYSTTSGDVALRRDLTDRIGGPAARAALARRFPSGSARDEIERRSQRAGAGGDVLAGLVDELAGLPG